MDRHQLPVPVKLFANETYHSDLSISGTCEMTSDIKHIVDSKSELSGESGEEFNLANLFPNERKPVVDSKSDVCGDQLLHIDDKSWQYPLIDEVKPETELVSSISSYETVEKIELKIELDGYEAILPDSAGDEQMTKNDPVPGDFICVKLEKDESDAFEASLFHPVKTERDEDQVECDDIDNTEVKGEVNDDMVYIDTDCSMKEHASMETFNKRTTRSSYASAKPSQADCGSVTIPSCTGTKQVVGASTTDHQNDLIQKSMTGKNRTVVAQSGKAVNTRRRRRMISQTDFDNPNALENDLRIHSGESPFQCEKCDKFFSQRWYFKTHMRIHSGEISFQCEKCDKFFSKHSSLKTHMRIHTGDKPFKCTKCDKSYSWRGHLENHLRVHTGERPFACEQCDKFFVHRSSLKNHMRIHSGNKPFKCTKCDKPYSRRADLETHLKVHSGERPFACKNCELSYYSLEGLKRHNRRIHSGEISCQCKKCDKFFTQRSSLKTHMRIHGEDLPFKCTKCDKSYSRRGHLETHLRVHTGERPFACEQCDTFFIHRSSLKKHMKLHSGDKPFKCSKCDRSYSQRGHLENHLRVHTGERPFACEKCEWSFYSREVLKKHNLRIHNGE